jgi:hypothetical protein
MTSRKTIAMKFEQEALSWVLLAIIVVISILGSAVWAHAEAANNSDLAGVKMFATPEQAAQELIDAAANFNPDTFAELFGPKGKKIVLTGESGYDRELAKAFSEQARAKNVITLDPKNKNRAILTVGNGDWPFPAPLVKTNGQWFFDAKAGQREIVFRRVGRNELDAIQICEGYVEAQHAYALKKREGYDVNQYAQRIISTPGKQDGLAWQNHDGSWSGPIGINIARAIAQGHAKGDPYHGYFFKVLTKQGPAAPLGEMDFVIKGAMIGGFALVAAPAEYGVTGIKTFMVGSDGVVYEKDLGPASLRAFQAMQKYNPDKTWSAVAAVAKVAQSTRE